MTAAVFAAAVFFMPLSGAHAQNAQPGNDRVPAGPANMFRPGAVFTYYAGTADPARIEGLNTALNTMTAQGPEPARAIAAARAGIEAGVAGSDPDALARTVATSIEETFSIVVQAGFLRAIQQTNPSFGDLLQTAQVNVELPDGANVKVPVLLAAAIHSLNVIAAGEKLRRDDADDLSGDYELTGDGTCAVADGPITITQRDFVVEGVMDDRLAMFGTHGGTRVFMVTNEPRFARVDDTPPGPPRIQVPDRPLDLFAATLPAAGAPIELRSISRGTCRLTLTKSN